MCNGPKPRRFLRGSGAPTEPWTTGSGALAEVDALEGVQLRARSVGFFLEFLQPPSHQRQLTEQLASLVAGLLEPQLDVGDLVPELVPAEREGAYGGATARSPRLGGPAGAPRTPSRLW